MGIEREQRLGLDKMTPEQQEQWYREEAPKAREVIEAADKRMEQRRAQMLKDQPKG